MAVHNYPAGMSKNAKRHWRQKVAAEMHARFSPAADNVVTPPWLRPVQEPLPEFLARADVRGSRAVEPAKKEVDEEEATHADQLEEADQWEEAPEEEAPEADQWEEGVKEEEQEDDQFEETGHIKDEDEAETIGSSDEEPQFTQPLAALVGGRGRKRKEASSYMEPKPKAPSGAVAPWRRVQTSSAASASTDPPPASGVRLVSRKEVQALQALAEQDLQHAGDDLVARRLVSQGMVRVAPRREVERRLASLQHSVDSQEDILGFLLVQLLRYGHATVDFADASSRSIYLPGWSSGSWTGEGVLCKLLQVELSQLVAAAERSVRKSGPRRGLPRVEVKEMRGATYFKATDEE